MQFNVAQLLKEPTGSLRRYQLAEDLSDLDPELHVLGPLVGELTLLRTNSGILARGELSTAVQVTCNRCLSPIAMPVRFALEESFRPTTEVYTGRPLRPDEYEGDAEDLDDTALLIDDKHILDLSEVVRQDIWLTLPMYPGCNWTGSGECPNLSRMPSVEDVRLLRPGEDAAEQGQDPRWSALHTLGGESDGDASPAKGA
jgi:uncharacterized protein